MGSLAETKTRSRKTWTTTDLVFIVVFDTVFGVLGTIFSLFSSLLASIPVVGSYLLYIISGLFGLGGMVPAYIIRVPLTAVLAIWIKNTVEFLTGDPYGVMGFAAAAGWTWGFLVMIDGIGRNKRWSTGYMMLTGGIANFAQNFPIQTYIFGYFYLPWYLWVPQTFFGAIIGGFFTLGLLTVGISQALLRTGVLGGTAIAEAERLKGKAKAM